MRGEVAVAGAGDGEKDRPERGVPRAGGAEASGARPGGVVVGDLIDAPAEEDGLVRRVVEVIDAREGRVGAAGADADVVLRGGAAVGWVGAVAQVLDGVIAGWVGEGRAPRVRDPLALRGPRHRRDGRAAAVRAAVGDGSGDVVVLRRSLGIRL